jgi:extradiol dioxygenase family protein
MLQQRNFTVQSNLFSVLFQDQNEEDINHLFFYCPFALACWHKLSIHWHSSTCIHERNEVTKHETHLPFFMEIFIVAAWELWNLRNAKIFDGVAATFDPWTVRFKAQVIELGMTFTQ